MKNRKFFEMFTICGPPVPLALPIMYFVDAIFSFTVKRVANSLKANVYTYAHYLFTHCGVSFFTEIFYPFRIHILK